MTEKLDLLSSSSTTSSTKTTSTDSPKKEGASLFDSLLAESKKQVETTSSEDNKTPSQTNTKENSTDTTEKTETPSKTVKTQNSEESTENKTNTTKENSANSAKEEASVPKVSSGSSLLDRLVLEAKKDMKVISKDEFDKTIKETNSSTLTQGSQTKEQTSSENIVKNPNPLSEDSVEAKDSKPVSTETKNNTSDLKPETITSEESSDETANKSEKIGAEGKDSEVKNTSLSDKILNPNISEEESKQVSKNNISESSIKEVINSSKENVNNELVKTENKIENKETSAKQTSTNTNTEVNKNTNVNTPVLDGNTDVEEVKTQVKTENTNKVETSLGKNVESSDPSVKTENANSLKQNPDVNTQTTKPLETKSEEATKEVKVNKSLETNTNEIKPESAKKELSDNITKTESTTTTNIKTPSENTSSEKNTNNLSKLDKAAIVDDEQRVNVDKKIINETPKSEAKTETKSLMDSLLDNAKNIKQVNPKEVEAAIKQAPTTPISETTNNKSGDVLTNIYLGSQKNSIYNQMLATKSEGMKVVKEENGVDSITKSANILDLGLEDVSVEVEESAVKTETKNNVERDMRLDRLILAKNARYDESISPSTTTTSSSESAKVTSSNPSTIEQAVTLNVSPSLALSIQNRIIGAQQQMSSMMSDVARNMYENYKPPVTAFRINLNPSNLGTIAIMMKNEKENGISISMNMSSSSTLDAFVESQGALRDALNKNFNNSDTSFNLDFNMQEEGQGNFDGQQKEQNKQESLSSNDILETITNVTEDLEEKLEYL